VRWVDAHCHLEPHDYPDPEPYVERARAAGLVHAVLVGQFQPPERGRPASFGAALEISARHPGFFTATMGLHPHDALQATNAEWSELERLCALPEVRAVGEAGLDYYYDRSPRDVQRDSLARQCALAKRVGKPLVVHVRDAHGDCAAILRAEGVARGQIHCFTGDVAAARAYLDIGFAISFSGVVTYKKTDALQEAARFVPLERLLVETDCPYLAPIPHRGKKNEPAFVVETGRQVASLRGMAPEELAEATSRNAAALFGFELR